MNSKKTNAAAATTSQLKIFRAGKSWLSRWLPTTASLAPAPQAPWLPPTADERRQLLQRSRALVATPRVLCLVLAERASVADVSRTVRSLATVVYNAWQAMVLGRGNSTIGVTPLPGRSSLIEARAIAATSDYTTEVNRLVAGSDADYVLFVEAGDCVVPDVLIALAEHVAEHAAADLIYGDEDRLDATGIVGNTFHKPDWSPALLLSQPYAVYPAFYRRRTLVEVGGLRAGWDTATLYDLALRFTERAETISHLPQVLYHRRGELPAVADSTGDRPHPSIWGATWLANRRGASARRRAVEAALERRRLPAQVTLSRATDTQTIRPIPQRHERVTMVVPTRDGGTHLERAIESILRRTTYPNYEVLIVDNGSSDHATRRLLQRLPSDRRVRVLEDPQPFNFSALNNGAIRQTGAPYVLLLNDDTQVISPGWLTDMVGWLEQPGVGAVGAKLLYTDGTIQHAGVALGIGGVASHPHKRFARRDAGYHGLLHSARECSAVTGACLLTRRDLFWQVGGLEEALPRAYNDVDYCLRLGERGYRVLFAPTAELYHHESVSRGRDSRDDAQFRHAIAWMQRRWGDLLLGDPFYHPNLSLRATNFAARQAA